MQNPSRYAVFFMPDAASALWQFGCRVTGYDAADPSRAALAPDDPFAAARAAGAFADAARYGFHATLKAPFELAVGASEAELLSAAREIATETTAIPLGRLHIARLHHFLALVPVSPPPALEVLAARCVEAFDRFRAPLSAADRARRLQSPLSVAEIAHLDRWGYPYVFEQFRFHMTLTGPLAPEQIGPMQARLAHLYASIDTEVAMDGFAIFQQRDRAGRFHVAERFVFSGGN